MTYSDPFMRVPEFLKLNPGRPFLKREGNKPPLQRPILGSGTPSRASIVAMSGPYLHVMCTPWILLVRLRLREAGNVFTLKNNF